MFFFYFGLEDLKMGNLWVVLILIIITLNFVLVPTTLGCQFNFFEFGALENAWVKGC